MVNGGPRALGDDIPRVNDTGDPAEHPEEDIDNHVGAAAALDEDGDWRDEERQEVQTHVCLGLCNSGLLASRSVCGIVLGRR